MKTIKDIAELAKVSTGTVDRVIHNRGGVAKKTEIRIKEIIEELGFTPNLVARNLVLKKTYKIAILIPKADQDSPFWETPILGTEKALQEFASFGCTADYYYFNQFQVSSYTKGLDKILASDYDGLILVPHFTRETTERKAQLNALNIPYVFFNVNLEGFTNISFMGQDSFQSGVLAGKLFHLTMPQDSSILIINFLEDLENHHSLHSRIQGIRNYFSEHPSTLNLDELKIKKFSTKELNEALTKRLDADTKIKGIFLPSSKISAIARYLEDSNLKMNTVIGYDITEKNITYINKNIITLLIGQEPFNQGYESVKILFNYLIHDIKPKANYFSPMHVITKENLNSYL